MEQTREVPRSSFACGVQLLPPLLPGLTGGGAGAQHKSRHLCQPVVANAIIAQPLAILTSLTQEPQLLLPMLLLLPTLGIGLLGYCRLRRGCIAALRRAVAAASVCSCCRCPLLQVCNACVWRALEQLELAALLPPPAAHLDQHLHLQAGSGRRRDERRGRSRCGVAAPRCFWAVAQPNLCRRIISVILAMVEGVGSAGEALSGREATGLLAGL